MTINPKGLWYRRWYGRHAIYFRIKARPGNWPMAHTHKVIYTRSTLPVPGFRPGTLSMVFTITGPTVATGMTLYVDSTGVHWKKCLFTFVDPKTISIKMSDPDLAHALPSALHRVK